MRRPGGLSTPSRVFLRQRIGRGPVQGYELAPTRRRRAGTTLPHPAGGSFSSANRSPSGSPRWRQADEIARTHHDRELAGVSLFPDGGPAKCRRIFSTTARSFSAVRPRTSSLVKLAGGSPLVKRSAANTTPPLPGRRGWARARASRPKYARYEACSRGARRLCSVLRASRCRATRGRANRARTLRICTTARRASSRTVHRFRDVLGVAGRVDGRPLAFRDLPCSDAARARSRNVPEPATTWRSGEERQLAVAM